MVWAYVSVAFEAILLFRGAGRLRYRRGDVVSVAFEAILLFRAGITHYALFTIEGFSRLRGDSFI